MNPSKTILPVIAGLLLVPALSNPGFAQGRGGSSGGGGSSHFSGGRSSGGSSFSSGSRGAISSGRSRSGSSSGISGFNRSRSSGGYIGGGSSSRSRTSSSPFSRSTRSSHFSSSRGSIRFGIGGSGSRGITFGSGSSHNHSGQTGNRSHRHGHHSSHDHHGGHRHRGSHRHHGNYSLFVLPYLYRNSYSYPSYNRYEYYQEIPAYTQTNDQIRITPLDSTAGERYFATAREAFRLRDYQLALRTAGHAAVEMPQNAELHQFISLSLFALGDFRGASSAAHAALSMGAPWDWATMQRFYPRAAVYTPHLRALEDAQEKTPHDVDKTFLLGYHYYVLGHRKEAVELLESAARLSPDDKTARGLLESLTGKKNGPAPPAPPRKPVPADKPVEEGDAGISIIPRDERP